MNIAIIDDQPILRMAIRSHLSESIPSSQFFEGANGKEAIDIIQASRIDVMLLDLAMPEMDGFEFLDYMQKRRIRSFKIIVFTFSNDLAVIHRLLHLGVNGFLTKDSHTELIKKAINEVMDNKLFLSSEFREKVLHMIQSREFTPRRFSAREKEIIEYIAQGKTSKEIASELDYTTRTVETKKMRIEKKFGAKNAAELISMAYKTGILKM